MKQSKRRGFTLVELLVVIAILAILASVSVIGYMGFTKKAHLSNDIGLVTQLNTVLKGEEAAGSKNVTLHDAALDLREAGYDIEKMTPTSEGFDIVWDQVNDRFLLKDGEEVKYSDPGADISTGSQLWKIVDAYEPALAYSQYLRNKTFEKKNTLEITTGLDLGENTEAFDITYKGTIPSATPVRIRTNGSFSNLTVNTADSNVFHYGSVGNANIEKVPTECYHEAGKAAYIKITAGKLVVEDTCEVKVLNVAAETGVQLEVKPAAVVEKASSKSADIVVETVLPQAQEVAQKDVEELAQAEVQKEAAKDQYDRAISVTDSEGNKEEMSIETFRNKVNGGNSFAGYIVRLESDVDLSNSKETVWTPIGDGWPGDSLPFSGIFDGQGHTISNLVINKSNKTGLFGNIVGAEPKYSVALDGADGNWQIYSDGKFNAELISEASYSTVIKNIVLENADVTSNASSCGVLAGTIVNALVENIEVKNSKLNVHNDAGGIIGYAVNSAINNIKTTEVSLYHGLGGSSQHIGGLVGKVDGAVIMNSTSNTIFSNNNNNLIYAGGIVGDQDPRKGSHSIVVYNVVNNSSFSDTGFEYVFAGGICSFIPGGARALFIDCVNNGNINIDSRKIGGILGNSDAANPNIINCVNNGKITNLNPNGTSNNYVGNYDDSRFVPAA